MDIAFLNEYLVLVVFGICLCIGFIIKSSLDFIPNKYIPLIMAILGVILNIWVAGAITPHVILGGLFSGLSSTGCHQLFKNLINKDGDNHGENE